MLVQPIRSRYLHLLNKKCRDIMTEGNSFPSVLNSMVGKRFLKMTRMHQKWLAAGQPTPKGMW